MPSAGRIVQTKAHITAQPDRYFAGLDREPRMVAESAQSVHSGYSSGLTGSACARSGARVRERPPPKMVETPYPGNGALDDQSESFEYSGGDCACVAGGR